MKNIFTCEEETKKYRQLVEEILENSLDGYEEILEQIEEYRWRYEDEPEIDDIDIFLNHGNLDLLNLDEE